MHDLDALLALAEDLARRAGALLLDGRAGRRAGLATKSSGTDMVTDMDRASEALIVDGLRQARPDDAVLAEEGSGHDGGGSGVRWVVDPLDGTTNYLYGHPCFAVSIAAEVDGTAAVGVVADPSRDEVFTAVRGGGAFCNGRPVQPSGLEDACTALVSTGFGYQPERRRRQAEVLAQILPHVRDVRRNGAAAIDLCWVACGRLDAHYESPLEPWDVAAGELIAREAGAATLALDGGPPSPSSILAVTPGVAEPLLRLLQEAGAGA